MFRNIDVHAASDFVLRWAMRILFMLCIIPPIVSLLFEVVQAGVMG